MKGIIFKKAVSLCVAVVICFSMISLNVNKEGVNAASVQEKINEATKEKQKAPFGDRNLSGVLSFGFVDHQFRRCKRLAGYPVADIKTAIDRFGYCISVQSHFQFVRAQGFL